MISFVYFDVGGVVISDFTAGNGWQELEKELGITKDDSQSFVEFWDEHEEELCVGRSVELLLKDAQAKFKLTLPKDYSILDGFAKRFAANRAIWPVIDKIKKECGVGLLTNMYPHMLELIYTKGIMPKVDWDVTIDSSIEHIAKPDPKIFEIAEERCKAKGKEILFVENGKRHVKAAKEFGWNTFLYDSWNLEKSSLELYDYYKSKVVK